MKPLRTAVLVLLFGVLPGVAGFPRGIERWLFIPHGENPRFDREPILRQPDGHYELKFLYQGRPPAIHRFGRSIAEDYPLPVTASPTRSTVPTISEVNRLLETLNQAAIDADSTAGAESTAENGEPDPHDGGNGPAAPGWRTFSGPLPEAPPAKYGSGPEALLASPPANP